MLGQYVRSIDRQTDRQTDRQLISEEDTILWLSRGDLKSETASEIITAQDQALHTKRHTKKYYKQKEMPNSDYVKN
jgi:hypothetical protein